MSQRTTMEDEGKLPVCSRFFKVLVPGFEQALRLPPIISMILNDGEIPEAAILVSRRGSWRVGVGEFNKGLTFNGKGWDSFVRCHDLSVGHFLLFEHTGDMHFHTIVFDSTTCEKEFPDDHTRHLDDENIKRKQDKTTSASYQQKKGIFQVKLQRYSIENGNPFLYIPTTFVNSNCLSKNATVTLINPSGDTWKVNLKIHYQRYGRSKRRRWVMYGGWRKFVKENKLKVGHVCVFQISHSSGRSNNSVVMNVRFIGL